MSLDPDAGLLELVAGSARAIGEAAASLSADAGAAAADAPASFGEASVAADAASALPGGPVPGVTFTATLGEGLTGTSLLMLGEDAAARLETSAGQLMAEVAGVASRLLGAPVEMGTCDVRRVADVAEAEAVLAGASGQAAFVDLSVGGEPCRLITVVPQTSAVRLRGALADRGGVGWAAPVLDEGLEGRSRHAMQDSLRTTRVRVSAEVGRTRLPVESLVGVPAGTVIELDRDADDPVDVYVNGRRFAVGRLVLTDTSEWAVRIERVL